MRKNSKLQSLEKRIRGWLPNAPALPQPQRKGLVSEHKQVPAKPDVPTMSDRRFQLVSGITIGLGAGLILVGFFGWSSTNMMIERFDSNSYLFRRLIDLMAIYLALISSGVYGLLSGILMLRSNVVRRLLCSKGPYYRLGGGLMGGGGALALISLRSLFVYIFTSEYFELRLFFVFFTVGVPMFACGIFALSRRNKKVQLKTSLKTQA
jgi:hypothetical protein